jgi:hypothetical protein
MNTLQKALIERQPTEKGGQIAEERFGYQKDWAICKLLELHSKGEDYLMIFEYHDDILILDSSETPNTVSFFQIKTKTTGNWTVSNLTKKQKANSYLGKLYQNKLNFPDFESTLNFVSNARFSFTFNDPSKKSIDLLDICCNDLAQSEKKLIISTLSKEFPTLPKIDLEEITYFKVSDIPVHNSEISSIAALVKYFEETTSDQFLPRLRPLHETLLNEIRRKSKYAFDVTSFEELVNCRSFTRKEFHNILTHALKVRSLDLSKLREQILGRLNAEKASIKFIQQFNRNSNQYLIDKLDISNELVRRLEKSIQIVMGTFQDDDFEQELIPCANMVFDKFETQFGNKYLQDKGYIQIVILFQIYGSH